MQPKHPIFFTLTLLLFIVSSDQCTKRLMTFLLATTDELSFAGHLVHLSLVENHDGFLGVAAPLPDTLRIAFLFGGVSLLVLACLAYLFFSKPSRLTVPLLFVTGGGLSNLLDRFMNNGGVTDFISIGFGTFRTGIFNLADVYILAGSTVLGYYLFSTSGSVPKPGITDSKHFS